MSLRIAYAGSIQIITQFATLFTGLAFVIIITRNLSVEEFGLWQVLGNTIGLAVIPIFPIGYWTLRNISRGEDVGKTAVYSGIISIPIIILGYIILLTFASTIFESGFSSPILYLAVIAMVQIPFLVLIEPFKAIIRGTRPQFIGYSSLGFEIAKVSVAYYLVHINSLSLIGAIISLAAAQLIQVLIMYYGSYNRIRGKFQINVARSWISASWIPFFGFGVSRIFLFDSLIVSLLAGTTIIVGLYAACKTFTSIVRYSEIFQRILYPKLMKDKLSSDVSMTLKLQTLVQVPLAIGAFMLAEPLLGILKADYVQVANVLRLLIIVAIFEGIENAVQNVLIGSEDSDKDINNLKFKILRKTWLFKLPLIDVFKSLFYVGGLAAIIFIFKNTTDNITLALYWGILYAGIVIPFTIVKYIAARSVMPFVFPKTQAIIYSIGGAIMVLFLQFYKNTFQWTQSGILETVIYIIPPGIISVGIYVIFVYIFEKDFRKLVQNLVKNISN